MKLRIRRDFFSRGLNELYLPHYKKLCSLLSPEWQPYYGYRSFEEQNRLYEMGRTLPGKIVTEANGGESPHNYGCATDWTIWDNLGNPIWLKVSDRRWDDFASACEDAGLRWGGDFSKPDCGHVELRIGTKWAQVHEIFISQGFLGAMQFVRKNLE